MISERSINRKNCSGLWGSCTEEETSGQMRREEVGAFQLDSQRRGIPVQGRCLGEETDPVELAGQRVQGEGWWEAGMKGGLLSRGYSQAINEFR